MSNEETKKYNKHGFNIQGFLDEIEIDPKLFEEFNEREQKESIEEEKEI